MPSQGLVWEKIIREPGLRNSGLPLPAPRRSTEQLDPAAHRLVRLTYCSLLRALVFQILNGTGMNVRRNSTNAAHANRRRERGNGRLASSTVG